MVRQKSPSQWNDLQGNLLENLDGTHSKFWDFINHICLIITLQLEHYSIEESHVGLVGTLLIKQTLSWFFPLFEKRSTILNNFDIFLEAFGEHDNACWAQQRINPYNKGHILHQVKPQNLDKLHASSIRTSKRQCERFVYINLGPQTLNDAINQVAKCDNWLLQLHLNQS